MLNKSFPIGVLTMKCKSTIYFLLFVTVMYASAQPKPVATLIITNAAVYTVDKQHPTAEAVAVIDSRMSQSARMPRLIRGADRKPK